MAERGGAAPGRVLNMNVYRNNARFRQIVLCALCSSDGPGRAGPGLSQLIFVSYKDFIVNNITFCLANRHEGLPYFGFSFKCD